MSDKSEHIVEITEVIPESEAPEKHSQQEENYFQFITDPVQTLKMKETGKGYTRLLREIKSTNDEIDAITSKLAEAEKFEERSNGKEADRIRATYRREILVQLATSKNYGEVNLKRLERQMSEEDVPEARRNPNNNFQLVIFHEAIMQIIEKLGIKL